MNRYLFAYGLLRKQFNHPVARYLHSHAEWIGDGYLHGKMYDTGNYPAAIRSGGEDGRVYGEVFRLADPKQALSRLDDYEQIGPRHRLPSEYVRQECPIRLGDNTLQCWVYLYNWPVRGLHRIISGDYIKYIMLGDEANTSNTNTNG